jgi:MFS transporter, putative metabolite:H+ symporter
VAGRAVMACYAGLAAGDLGSGLLSQWLRSRRKVVLLFLLLTLAFTVAYLNSHGAGSTVFYGICFALGFGTGYWAVFVTVATEQFGTNLRATVTTTVPNFVRGSVVPMTSAFAYLKGTWGILPAAAALGVVALGVALAALGRLEETFHKDMNYIEDLP